MEEGKLARMATAISEYTTSSMLHETVHTAAESISQAVHLIDNCPWISDRLRSEVEKQQQDLARLEQIVAEYQKERAAEVEDAQKDVMPARPLRQEEGSGEHPDTEE